jgi:hypothetical protein
MSKKLLAITPLHLVSISLSYMSPDQKTLAQLSSEEIPDLINSRLAKYRYCEAW